MWESPFPLWVNFLLFAAGGIWMVRTIKANFDVRQRQLADLAARLGLGFTATDAFDLAKLPFELFQVSGGTMFTNVLYGDRGGLNVTAFDHRHLASVGDQKVSAFSCVLTPLDMNAPPMIVERQTDRAYRLGPTVRGAARVSTESTEFDRAFHVRCDDRRFALDILDPAFMGWLLGTYDDWNFELSGNRLLCYSPQRRPGAIESLLDAAGALRSHVRLGTGAAPAAGTSSVAPTPPLRRPIRVQTAATLAILAAGGIVALLIFAVLLYLWWSGQTFAMP